LARSGIDLGREAAQSAARDASAASVVMCPDDGRIDHLQRRVAPGECLLHDDQHESPAGRPDPAVCGRQSALKRFVSEFRGLSSTGKQKALLAAIGASHVSLRDFFGRHKANGENIARLLAALKEHSKPVRPRQLGVIGKDHFYRLMESAGGDPKTFTYNRAFDETDDGVPYVSEFAFGVHRDGLIAGRGPRRKEITGVNWSPGIKNPFRELGRGGAGMDTILSEVRANISQPVIVALHLACPRVAYTDRGKSAIVVEGKAEGNDHDED
jgi:hypothetical protein